jgi:N-acylglucosamine 2-epimerase
MVVGAIALEFLKKQVGDKAALTAVVAKTIASARKHFYPAMRIFLENVAADVDLSAAPRFESPDERLFSPGHSIEVAWFVLEMLEYAPNEDDKAMALEALEGSLERGWDHEGGGGLFYFLDVKGRPLLQLEGLMKLWWPHTEAIIALLMAYKATRDAKWLEWLDKVHGYSYTHFVDTKGGEWFGYLNRDGSKNMTCKGGNYKGMFHVPRALLMAHQLISQITTEVKH